MQQNEADQVPDGLVEEGGVPVAGNSRNHLNAHAQEEVVVDLRAEGLPVEEIAPAADALADQQAQRHDVQIGRQLLLLHLGEEQQAQGGADDAAVDGDAALPDVESGNRVVLVVVPLEDHVVDSGADDGQGNGEENRVDHAVHIGAELLDPPAHVENRQQEAQGDDHAVEIDFSAEDGKGQGPGQVQPLNPQPGEGNCAVV